MDGFPRPAGWSLAFETDDRDPSCGETSCPTWVRYVVTDPQPHGLLTGPRPDRGQPEAQHSQDVSSAAGAGRRRATIAAVTVDDAMAVFAALQREDVAYVLVGAVAMAIQGEVRATQDIDLFVSPDEENVRRLREALNSVFSDPELAEITSEDLGGDYSVVRYVPPEGDYAIDLIARLGDAFLYDDLQWETLVRDGVAIRVATPGTLYRMKRDTLRWKDRVDADRLRERFGLEEG